DGQDGRQQEVQFRQNLQFNRVGHGPPHCCWALLGVVEARHEELAGNEAGLRGAHLASPFDAFLAQHGLERGQEHIHLCLGVHVQQNTPDQEAKAAHRHEQQGKEEIPFLTHEFPQRIFHGVIPGNCKGWLVSVSSTQNTFIRRLRQLHRLKCKRFFHICEICGICGLIHSSSSAATLALATICCCTLPGT